MRGWKLPWIIALSLLVLASPAAAEKGDNAVRGGVQYVFPSGELFNALDNAFDAEIMSAVGVGVEYERYLTDIVGIDVGYAWSKHDVKWNGEKIGDFTLTGVPVAVNFHVVRKERVDFYLGPVVGWYRGEYDSGDARDHAGFGGTLGIDLLFGKGGKPSVGFSAAAKFMSLKFEDDGDELELNPWALQAGVVIRF
jgi:hypothetical protein